MNRGGVGARCLVCLLHHWRTGILLGTRGSSVLQPLQGGKHCSSAGLLLIIDVRECLPVAVSDDETRIRFHRPSMAAGNVAAPSGRLGPAKRRLNIRQAPHQNHCRSFGKALSDFLERISGTQHGTILPMPPD